MACLIAVPELPEVETVVRGLARFLPGNTIRAVDQRRPDLRFPFPDRFAARLGGERILAVTRRAKYIVATLAGGDDLVIHLGMTGRLSIANAETAPSRVLGDYVYNTPGDGKHDHVVLHLTSGQTLTYNDPRRFGFMLLIKRSERAQHPLFVALGAEPLSAEFDGAYLARRAAGTSVSLKTFLMDQRVVAGLGNIYVSEALFRAGLSPSRAARTLARGSGAPSIRAERLATAVKAVLLDAITAGGSTLRDYRATDGAPGDFQRLFSVYGREGAACARHGCSGKIRRTVQAGRATFACGTCQR